VKFKSLETIFRTLNEAQSRYLVVGGIAVVAHGYIRVTNDLDLVLDLSSEALGRSLEALSGLGYKPINPGGIFDFADPEKRRDWTENRNMVVFNLVSDRFPDVAIDIFAKDPFIFDTEYDLASWREFAPGIAARVVALETLIKLKTEANRLQDKLDIEKLRKSQAANE
jgi:hypothetical protein